MPTRAKIEVLTVCNTMQVAFSHAAHWLTVGELTALACASHITRDAVRESTVWTERSWPARRVPEWLRSVVTHVRCDTIYDFAAIRPAQWGALRLVYASACEFEPTARALAHSDYHAAHAHRAELALRGVAISHRVETHPLSEVILQSRYVHVNACTHGAMPLDALLQFVHACRGDLEVSIMHTVATCRTRARCTARMVDLAAVCRASSLNIVSNVSPCALARIINAALVPVYYVGDAVQHILYWQPRSPHSQRDCSVKTPHELYSCLAAAVTQAHTRGVKLWVVLHQTDMNVVIGLMVRSARAMPWLNNWHVSGEVRDAERVDIEYTARLVGHTVEFE